MSARCLLYARVSSEAQATPDRTSLDSQLEACRELANREGWEVVAEVRDDVSGHTLDRSGLDMTRHLVREGRVDVVVAHKQERLSRSQTDTGILYREFSEAGVRIWTVMEGTFDDTPTGQFLRQVYAFAAELDRAQRKEATSRGAREKVRNGKILGAGATPAYGYDWIFAEKPNGKRTKVAYTVNEPEADVVRGIYADYAAGKSQKAIARSLNEAGIPSPFGLLENYRNSGRWGHQTIAHVLRSPYYAGIGVGFIHAGRERGERALRKRYSGAGIHLPEGTIPAIVDPELWERVQNILDSRPGAGSRPANREHGLLRRLAFCGVCGRRMKLKTRTNGNKYLGCYMATAERKPCPKPSPSIKLEWLEEAVWSVARTMVLNPYRLRDRFASDEQAIAEERELAALEVKLQRVIEQRRRLLANLEILDPEEVDDLRPRLDELKFERKELERQVDGLRSRLTNRNEARDRLERIIDWAAKEAYRIDTMEVEEKHALLQELGIAVHVFPVGSPERFRIDVGAEVTTGSFFADVDWASVGEPTEEERREEAAIRAVETDRGMEAVIVGQFLAGGPVGVQSWDYWDLHVREALAQHARVLGIERISPQRSREQGPIGT
jgi:site-specific DNA recombinase